MHGAPSYAHGASRTPLLGETIGENLRRTVHLHGDREALVVHAQGYRATYRELWDTTTRVAIKARRPSALLPPIFLNSSNTLLLSQELRTIDIKTKEIAEIVLFILN